MCSAFLPSLFGLFIDEAADGFADSTLITICSLPAMDIRHFLSRWITMDGLVFLVLGFAMAGLYFFCDPHHIGFYCNDFSIRKPLKPLTVNLATIITFASIIPTAVIIYTEHYHGRDYRWRLKRFFFAGGLNLMTTLFFKFGIGRLRPHFYEVCNPNVDCDDLANHNQFIENYTCQNPSRRAVKQVRQSFFSGHASISINAAIYLIIYIQVNYRNNLFKTLIQFGLLLLGIYPGITQVNNFWHHWSDVAVGYAFGTACATINFNFV